PAPLLLPQGRLRSALARARDDQGEDGPGDRYEEGPDDHAGDYGRSRRKGPMGVPQRGRPRILPRSLFGGVDERAYPESPGSEADRTLRTGQRHLGRDRGR